MIRNMRHNIDKSSYYPMISRSLKSSKRKISRSLDSRRLLVFFVGVFIGVTLALLLHHYQSGSTSSSGSRQHSINIFEYFFDRPLETTSNILNYINAKYNFTYENWLEHMFGGYSIQLDPDKHRYTTKNESLTLPNVKDDISGFIVGSEAHFLYKHLPVICIVFSPTSTKSITAVSNTWGQHCNAVHFYYSSSRHDGVKGSTRRKHNKENVLIYNDTNSDNEFIKQKVFVNDIPQAKSEFALFCRAFHSIQEKYPQNSQVCQQLDHIAEDDNYIVRVNFNQQQNFLE